MQQSATGQYFYLRVIYKRRLALFVFIMLSTITAAIFSGPSFITPLFRAEAIIYPPGTNSNRMLIDRDARFGSDKEIDEQIQLLRSTGVRDSLISKYKLLSHYKINPSAPDKRYRLNRVYNSTVSIDRTRFNSISISVTDHNPEFAAGMANDIVSMGDRLRSAIIKEKLREAFTSLSKSMFDISLEIDQLADQINNMFKQEVVSGSSFFKNSSIRQLKEQLEVEGLKREARDKSNTSQLERLYLYEAKLQQFSTLQISYDQALVSLNNDIPTSYVISRAEIPDKKSYPVRWTIVIAAMLGSFVAGCLLIILFDRYKSVLAQIRR